MLFTVHRWARTALRSLSSVMTASSIDATTLDAIDAQIASLRNESSASASASMAALRRRRLIAEFLLAQRAIVSSWSANAPTLFFFKRSLHSFSHRLVFFRKGSA